MTTRIVEYFEVIDNGVDGRAHDTHVAAFMNEQDAKAMAGTWLRYAKKTIVIHDTKADYDNHKSSAMKTAALGKLTKEDRLILGLE